MRHIYLTYLSQKVEIPVAQSVAGHEDQETTSRYITALPDHVSAVVRAVQIGGRSWVD
ncbi:MAG: hypothetical protein VYA69_16040 [Gemmatimonadota bacterium]|nr:hypothetical protein [Gemmatimonadota bacterium]